VAGLAAVERDVFGRALLAFVAVDQSRHGLGRRHFARDGFGELAPERQPPLLGDPARLVVAGRTDHLLEARVVELAVEAAERRVFLDAPRHFCVGQAKAELTRAFIERVLRNQAAEQLLVEAQRTRLIGRDGPPDLASDLLQALVIDLPELLDPDLGVADLGEAGPAEAAENVADSPDREAYDQEAHDGRHDRL